MGKLDAWSRFRSRPWETWQSLESAWHSAYDIVGDASNVGSRELLNFVYQWWMNLSKAFEWLCQSDLAGSVHRNRVDAPGGCHVLYKVDCDTHLKERSSTTNGRFGRETYFQQLYRANRNDLLKEYEGKLVLGRRCQCGPRICQCGLVYVYANPTNTNSYNQTLAVNYSADTIKNSNGIKVLRFSEMLSIFGTGT